MTATSTDRSDAPVPAEPRRSRPVREPGRPLGQRLGVDRFSGLYVWLGIVVLFSVLEPSVFPTLDNARVVGADAAITAIVALGLTVSLASGAFDVSISASMTWGIVFVCWLQSVHGLAPPVAILLTVATCALIGLCNGLIVVRLHVEPIITTMGTTAIVAALAFWRQDGMSIVTGIPEEFKDLGRGDILGVPSTAVYLAVIAAALWYFMAHTPVGRYLYALGGNQEAARLAGLRVDRLTVLAFVISATVAGLAGILLAAKVGSAGINQGSQYLLPAFAAAFLGSTQIRPGRFNIMGTLVAIYLVVTGTKGLQLVYPGQPWIKELFTGVALIAAVAIGARSARRVRLVQDEPPADADR
ncbi:MAG: ABC transporter permease [Acidimicrobiia bacterium]